jgi:hypothetical protein
MQVEGKKARKRCNHKTTLKLIKSPRGLAKLKLVKSARGLAKLQLTKSARGLAKLRLMQPRRGFMLSRDNVETKALMRQR